ncbi:MAG: metallophosphoesterase [Coxiellaceae bacterium]|nr:metallophosphoesterase [Coxiellaceae bacterium]
MNLAWMTDIHLNFVEPDQRQVFYDSILKTDCDGLLITGDIVDANNFASVIKEMTDHINKPMYFVLGNHDYYGGNVTDVRNTVSELTQSEKHLHWLPFASHQLNDHTALVGQDGWADGRYGDFENSRLSKKVNCLITDLSDSIKLGDHKLLSKMQQLADHDADMLAQQVHQVIESQQPKRILVLTHVPPFKESSVYRDKMSSIYHLPFYASKATGDILLALAKQYPSVKFDVLCGHTHGNAFYQPVSNLSVNTGHADFYRPTVQRIITV